MMLAGIPVLTASVNELAGRLLGAGDMALGIKLRAALERSQVV